MTTSTPHPAATFERRELELDQGPIRYRDSGGEGAPVVFVHGLLVDGRLWDGVAERLAPELRCLVVDWPMGSHTAPMKPGADLSPVGQARIVADFIERLGLGSATIVGNDSGGAISQILATRHPERVERLVLTNCDSFEKFPPFPFNLMAPIARLPGGTAMLQAPLRLGAARRAIYGLLAKRPIAPELVDSWLAPSARDAAIARDTRKLLIGLDKRLTLEAADRLGKFDRPALLAWGTDDRFFTLADAKRLAGVIPAARLVEIDEAKTFVALDQPERLAELIESFVSETQEAEIDR
ncbi:MAG: alpha/beta hydrolase [Solirubrobacterales bacterium]|nr:alpha/beta hydrolase [Solirubrobacterales bacterium]